MLICASTDMPTLHEVLADLKQRVKAADGNQAAVARELGINPQYLNDILRKRREPGPMVLRAMGWKKSVSYERGKA